MGLGERSLPRGMKRQDVSVVPKGSMPVGTKAGEYATEGAQRALFAKVALHVVRNAHLA